MKFDPLNDGKSNLELIDYMGGDLKVVNSAKQSYENYAESVGEKEVKLLETLIMPFLRFGVNESHPDIKHASPLRSTAFTCRVRLPLFLCMQFYKHTIASCFVEEQRNWQQGSHRYIKASKQFDYYYAKARPQSAINKQGSGKYDEFQLLDGIEWEIALEKMVSQGEITIQELENLKTDIANELINRLRCQYVYTTVEWTFSLESALHFCDLRDAGGAQWEIQQYAIALKQILEDKCPEVFKLWNKRKHIIRKAVREYLVKYGAD